ncbi:efflux RND transporter periplasmic adaptor subunit [Zhihengliuella halotolerans]|uniref:efflux RND transporter periplasmic adaptor subunit n=1 Tax=Zhihengliuella halotolerans TaxID=370736 RepID=UPI00102CA913|nr:efflux RND transporter periplasmic adaptor subunit [Zhihengliuella halotolerans]
MSSSRAVRRTVVAVLWLAIGLLIAVSLVKLAFFDGAVGAADDALYPTGQIPVEAVSVETGTVENSLAIDGTITLDSAEKALAPADGEVNYAFVAVGDRVVKGERILQVRSEVLPEPADEAPLGDEDDVVLVPAAPEPRVTYTDVYAPADGKLADFAIHLGDEVAKDDELATIQPETFTATGTINPLDRYRLLDASLSAVVTIEGGPEPFGCDRLVFSDAASEKPPEPTAEEEMMGEEPGGENGSSVSCRVPGHVTVFDGLSMSMEIDAGTVDDAVVVPVTAVRGLVGAGTVWSVDDSGNETERDVDLGVTDGKMVQVTSGLKPGDQVLRFVPGSDPELEPGFEEMGYYE